MGWFGGGDSNNDSSNDSVPQSGSEPGFSDSGHMSSLYSGGGGGGGGVGGSGGGSGWEEFQEFSVQLQQQVLVQQVITELSHRAFEKCASSSSTTSSQLSGKEAACISAVTNKWLDANEFLAGRLQRKQQQASAGQHFG